MKKGLSIIAGLMLINSFYIPWYKFTGITNISPLDVFNAYISQPLTSDSIWKIASMAGILILGGLMLLTSVFSKLTLSVIKLVLAVFLLLVHVGYFYANVLAPGTPIEWIKLYETSPGFLIFLIALALYFFTVMMAIVFSPVKGVTKLVGL